MGRAWRDKSEGCEYLVVQIRHQVQVLLCIVTVYTVSVYVCWHSNAKKSKIHILRHYSPSVWSASFFLAYFRSRSYCTPGKYHNLCSVLSGNSLRPLFSRLFSHRSSRNALLTLRFAHTFSSTIGAPSSSPPLSPPRHRLVRRTAIPPFFCCRPRPFCSAAECLPALCLPPSSACATYWKVSRRPAGTLWTSLLLVLTASLSRTARRS